MNEELKQRANEALASMIEGLEKASDFAVDQAPLVVQELLTWGFVSSFISMLLSFLMIIGPGVGLFYSIGKANNEPDEMYECLAIGCGILWVFLGIGGIVLLFENGGDWIKIWVAPRIYLLDYAAQLVK